MGCEMEELGTFVKSETMKKSNWKSGGTEKRETGCFLRDREESGLLAFCFSPQKAGGISVLEWPSILKRIKSTKLRQAPYWTVLIRHLISFWKVRNYKF